MRVSKSKSFLRISIACWLLCYKILNYLLRKTFQWDSNIIYDFNSYDN